VITKLALLDIVPTGESFARADKEFALGYWIWSFLAAPVPIPEQLAAAAPDLLVNHMLDSWSDDPAAFSPELRQAYIASFRDPATVAAICEEYRADTTRHLMDFLRPPGEPPSSPPRCTGSRSTS
jgi:haloacetate dehalogenase